MQCPKCGTDQPAGREECIGCGLVFAKYKSWARSREEEETTGQLPGRASRVRPGAAKGSEGSLAGRPIGRVLRMVRVCAGLAGVGLGMLLFVHGDEYVLGPLQVVLLMAYGCVGLFWLVSAVLRIPVPIKQFAIETFLFIAAAVLLKATFPQAFDVGEAGASGSGPPQFGSAGHQAAAAKEFLSAARTLAAEARAVLDPERQTIVVAHWSEQCADAKEAYRGLGKGVRQDYRQVYAALAALEERMDLAAGARVTSEVEAALEAVGEVEKQIAAAGP